jgi:hypothetical protein
MLRTLIFPVQDHRRDGVMLGVAEGYERCAHTASSAPITNRTLNFKNPEAEPTNEQQTLI